MRRQAELEDVQRATVGDQRAQDRLPRHPAVGDDGLLPARRLDHQDAVAHPLYAPLDVADPHVVTRAAHPTRLQEHAAHQVPDREPRGRDRDPEDHGDRDGEVLRVALEEQPGGDQQVEDPRHRGHHREGAPQRLAARRRQGRDVQPEARRPEHAVQDRREEQDEEQVPPRRVDVAHHRRRGVAARHGITFRSRSRSIKMWVTKRSSRSNPCRLSRTRPMRRRASS